MFALAVQSTRLYPAGLRLARMSTVHIADLGSGTRKGGGCSGSIRDPGAATFGKKDAAAEEEYFYKMQQKLLYKLKNKQIDQADFHRKQINQLQEAVQRHKEYLMKLEE